MGVIKGDTRSLDYSLIIAHVRVLIYSCYTTITGGVLLTDANAGWGVEWGLGSVAGCVLGV